MERRLSGGITAAQVEKWLAQNPEAAKSMLKGDKLSKSSETIGDENSPKMQRALFDIAKMLNESGLEVKSIINKVLHVALGLVPAEKCSLFLLGIDCGVSN